MNNIVETIFKGDRFYVRVPSAIKPGVTVLMPRANYVWLKSNPSFKEIPRGYVIHHLDHDKTNDDPSNLVLMFKFHHVAYHWKQKITIVPIKIMSPEIDFKPLYKPRVYFKKRHSSWFIKLREEKNNGNGKKYSIRTIFSYMGHKISSKEEGEFIANQIWEMYGDGTPLWPTEVVRKNTSRDDRTGTEHKNGEKSE